MNDRIVAVIMAVYHGDQPYQVQRAIDSIRSQTIECDLYIGVDGPVGTDIKTILDVYKDSYIKIIEYARNRGLAPTLNDLIDTVLQKSSYFFIARMDADDISKCDRLEVQLDYLNRHTECDILGSSCIEIDESGNPISLKTVATTHADILNAVIAWAPMIHPTVVFRRKVFDDGWRYPCHTFLTEDQALWLKLLEAGYTFSNIEEPLLYFSVNNETFRKRVGRKKLLSEIKLRLVFMFKLKKFSLKNMILICLRIVHILPANIYRKLRIFRGGFK